MEFLVGAMRTGIVSREQWPTIRDVTQSSLLARWPDAAHLYVCRLGECRVRKPSADAMMLHLLQAHDRCTAPGHYEPSVSLLVELPIGAESS